MDFNNLLADERAKKKLVLSTSEGKYEVPSIMRRWSPNLEFFRNYMTAIAYPVRSSHKGKDIGGNIKYVVEFIPEKGEEEIVLIHPRDYQLKKFRGFSLTQESLSSKKALKDFFQKTKEEGKLRSKEIIVHELEEWRDKAHNFYRGQTIQTEYVSAFQYYVVGRIHSKYSNWKTNRLNARRMEGQESDKTFR
jgi:hypothetical protein